MRIGGEGAVRNFSGFNYGRDALVGID